MIERYTRQGYIWNSVLLVTVLLTVAVAIGCATGEPEDRAPTATPEWFEHYPDHYYIDPEKSTTLNVDPTGRFFADQMVIDFRRDVPKEKIAEILAEKGLEVMWYLPLTGVFIVQVDPAQRDAVLVELQASPDVEYADRSGVAHLNARSRAEEARRTAR